MRPTPLELGLDPFDLEGYLFVHFPIGAWLDGSARSVLEAEVRRNGDTALNHATILTALTSMMMRPLNGLKPWEVEVEVVRLAECPETAVRFPPYWVQNGGKHTPEELNRRPDWDFGGEADTWDFGGADNQKTCASSPDGWDFGADGDSTGGKTAASSPEDGWGF